MRVGYYFIDGHSRSQRGQIGLMAALLLLTACDKEEGASTLSARNEVPMASAPILNRQAQAKDVPAPPPAASSDASVSPPAPAIKAAPPSSETRYRAIGTEPFWAVTVKGSVLALERPDRAPLRLAITRTDDGRAIRYLGEGFAMTVTEGPCSDGMSDAVWADRVSVTFGEGTLKGCGGVREDF